MKIHTTIYVVPTAKGRPNSRIAHKGGKSFVQVYTPPKTQDAEAMIKAMIRTQVMKLGKFEAGVPIRLEVTFFLEKPKSTTKKVLLPVKRPDSKNLLALLEDALNKYVWADDAQITTHVVRKRFGSPPRIELWLEEDAV
jgi:Holliday junction resolvase RusA-like endonuclease